jgi:hypothetical protein
LEPSSSWRRSRFRSKTCCRDGAPAKRVRRKCTEFLPQPTLLCSSHFNLLSRTWATFHDGKWGLTGKGACAPFPALGLSLPLCALSFWAQGEKDLCRLFSAAFDDLKPNTLPSPVRPFVLGTGGEGLMQVVLCCLRRPLSRTWDRATFHTGKDGALQEKGLAPPSLPSD